MKILFKDRIAQGLYLCKIKIMFKYILNLCKAIYKFNPIH